ncbi:MAG TPA: ATP-dependent DNA ligase [Jatrophihabitans sp.]|nr:ATP-dependent DNA ligase [Jatrophihabitans sp.]
MLLATVAAASAELTATSARSAKTSRLAELLAGTEGPAETTVVVSWLSGALTQRQIGVGWASLRRLPPPADQPSLTVTEVEQAFSAIGSQAGEGSQGRRQQLLTELFGRATGDEQVFLRRVITGELRQGALIGVMTDAIALASGAPLAEVRRAAMVSGSLPAVAASALHAGTGGLTAFQLQVGRPIGPMLAQTATSTDEALAALGTAAFEWKLDGVRIQVHRSAGEVGIFTRTLDDITARLPDVAEAMLALPSEEFVLDAEAIGLRADDRPVPFQVTAARLASRGSSSAAPVPLTTFAFDLLRLDGADLLGVPAESRYAALAELVPSTGPVRTVPRLVTGDPEQARAFLAEAVAHGHEGVLAKSLTAPYQAGRRGAGWLKVKPVHTLDLVVLAVEWGNGRRTGKLSNIHLGALAEDGAGFVMLGKTFKGMTDAMLAWQTERFLELADGPTDGYVVRLRPEQVVEIAFDGVQRSSRYPGGVALRFARVLRYRDDKTAAEADTIGTVRTLLG